jgi:uncharacterized protein (TIGR03435 family)
VKAQAPAASAQTFEVASIRRNLSGPAPGLAQPVITQQHRLTGRNVTVRELIRYAYRYQYRPASLIKGGPDWLDSERFDLLAQAEEPFEAVPRRGLLPADAEAMLRSLLEERFQLKVRTEISQEPAYALVVDRADGKLGPGLTPPRDDCFSSMIPMNSPDPAHANMKRCPMGFSTVDGASQYEMGNVTITDIAGLLSTFPIIDAVVVDQTGLTGRYTMKVRFQGVTLQTPDGRRVPAAVAEGDVPPLPGAVRQQLGLRLERTRATVEVLIIERVERPTEN